MPTRIEIQKSASRLLVDHVKFEYDDLANTWRDIEKKAQGTIAISGIFLTALVLTFRDIESPTEDLKYLAIFSILSLTFTALVAIWALSVSTIENVIEDAGKIHDAAKNIFNASTDDQARKEVRNFVTDRIVQWEKCNKELSVLNNIKAGRVSLAQGSLIISLAFVIITVISCVYDGNP